MNTLTQNAINLKSMEKNTYEWDLLFSEVFAGVQASSKAIVNSYAYSLKGDVDAGHSLAMEHILTTIDKFEFKGFEFLTFYKKTLNNRMVDLVRSINAEKAKHNTSYSISLSMDVTDTDGSTFGVEDRLVDSHLQTVDEYSFDSSILSISNLLDEYALRKPVDADLVQITMMYSAANGFKKNDMAQAVASYFNEDTYSNKLQAKVYRATKSFKKYASEAGYVFNF